MDIRKITVPLKNFSDPKSGEENRQQADSPLSKGDRLHNKSDHELTKIRSQAGKPLKKKDKDLQSLDRELISFSYVSSNDLQEPLRKIQTFSSRILEKEIDNLSDKGKEYFTRMQRAANRMQHIIDDLVLFSKLNTGNKNFELTDMDVLVAEVLQTLRPLMHEKKASIRFKSLGKVWVIREQMWQLVYNLLANSLKFSQPGKPLDVHISSSTATGDSRHPDLDPAQKYYHLRFRDNGIGFEKKFCDRIFEVFQRLHGQDEYEGTGIGLSICKKIVENHSGHIHANGELNKGATFDVYLPVQDQA